MEDLCVSVGVGLERVLVNDPFVEDESVAFGVRCYFELFGGWVSVEEVGVDDRDVPSFVERIKNFIMEVLTHDVIVELSGSTHVERETSDFAADFALLGFVTVILGSSRSEFGDGITVIEFVGHVSEIVTEWNVRVIGFGCVDDRVRVEVEDTLLELLEITV